MTRPKRPPRAEREPLAPGTYWVKRPDSDWVAAKCGRIESGQVVEGVPTIDEVVELWALPGKPWSITSTDGWEIGPRIPSPDERPAPADGDLAEAVSVLDQLAEQFGSDALYLALNNLEAALAAYATRAPEREREASEAMREAAAAVAKAEVARHNTGSGFDSSAAYTAACRIEVAIRALPLPPAAEREEDGHG